MLCIILLTNSVVMKKYRLLRDNKETGPYAAEELIQSGLKKYDLIWVDGKSAAWRYPCEIDVFKPYVPPVEEQPFDRFYKKPSASSTQQVAATVATTEAPALTTIAVKKEKPRFRIKAECQKIETAVATVVPAIQTQTIAQAPPVSYNTFTEPVRQTGPVTTAATPAWENMWMDWEQEKKAVANASVSYKTVNDRIKALGAEDDVLETKFSQSLDAIKERYVEAVLKRKKSSGNFDKYKSHLTAAVLLTAILAAGMWVGLKWSSKTGFTEAKTPQQDVQLIPNETNTNTAENNDAVIDNTPAQEENAVETSVAEDRQEAIVTPAAAINKKAVAGNQQKNSVPAKNAVVTTTVQKNNTIPKTTVENAPAVQKNYQPAVTDANGARSSVKRNHEAVNTSAEPAIQQPVASNEIKREVKKVESIDDYVDVESYPVSSGVQYNVSNISDVPLDMIMIDLQYFDANGKYLKGETLTINNIEPGTSAKVNAPQNAKAAGIKYKVSMISSEQNDLNIIAD